MMKFSKQSKYKYKFDNLKDFSSWYTTISKNKSKDRGKKSVWYDLGWHKPPKKVKKSASMNGAIIAQTGTGLTTGQFITSTPNGGQVIPATSSNGISVGQVEVGAPVEPEFEVVEPHYIPEAPPAPEPPIDEDVSPEPTANGEPEPTPPMTGWPPPDGIPDGVSLPPDEQPKKKTNWLRILVIAGIVYLIVKD